MEDHAGDLSASLASVSSLPSVSVHSLGLPAEVIEHILVLSILHGSPYTVGRFSQTCKEFRALVYHAPDQHLWRRIFLMIFDDPRPVLGHLRHLGVSNLDTVDVSQEFDWFQEFKQRIEAAQYLRHHASLVFSESDRRCPTVSAPFPPRLPSRLWKTLHSLNSVLLTAQPSPATPSITYGVTTDAGEDSPFPNYPAFPPLVLFIVSAGSLASTLSCLNAPWLEELLQNGYPPALTRRLLADPSPAGWNYPDPDGEFTALSHASWNDTEEARLFYKLVCCTGFIPMRTAEETGEEAQDSDSSDHSMQQHRQLTAERQAILSRRFARIVVYNLRYLWHERCWGPFLPITVGDNVVTPRAEGEDAEEGDDLMPLIVGAEETVSRSSPPVDLRRLYPDYMFLACARILVEANLKDMLADTPRSEGRLEALIEALRSLENARMGASPGFWVAQQTDPRLPRPLSEDDELDSSTSKGKEKDETEATVEGWDWAGVEGQWKRCVCWLDYRDLLVHNLHSGPTRFNDETLVEVIRIIPLTVRIKGYSRNPSMDSNWPPIIHVEGEMAGPPVSKYSIRRMSGTVSMIGDGAIRWSLVSSRAGGTEPEWANEGVQIGGVGSALGVLGLWTGAEHERTDPIGPFWAWKVA